MAITATTTSVPLSHPLESKSPAELLSMLESCPPVIFESVVREIMNRICLHLGNLHYTLRESDRQNRIQMLTISRPHLCLRGFSSEKIAVLVLAEEDQNWRNSDFWRHVTDPKSLPIIITSSSGRTDLARRLVGANYALVLDVKEAEALMSNSNGLENLKQILLSHYCVTYISPFDNHLVSSGPLFRGRRHEIARLIEKDRCNFVLIAPSGMGKSSMLEEYQLRVRVSKSSRELRFTSLFKHAVSDTTVYQVVMRCIDGGSKDTYYADSTLEGLKHVLAMHKSRGAGLVELIIDEVDEHIHLSAMKALVDLARRGFLRLILAGRWNLCREVRHGTDGTFDRMQTIMLESLSPAEADDLLLQPLRDMRIDIKTAEPALKAAMRDLAFVPSSLHEFGHNLVDIVRRGDRIITADLVNVVTGQIAKARRINGVLNDLSSDTARVAALLLLLNPVEELDPSRMKGILETKGVLINVSKAAEICDELVILHALVSPEPDLYRPGSWRGARLNQAQRNTCEERLRELLPKVAQTQNL